MKTIGFNVTGFSGWSFWRNFASPISQARACLKILTRPGNPWHGHEFPQAPLAGRDFVPHLLATPGGVFLIVRTKNGELDVIPKPADLESWGL